MLKLNKFLPLISLISLVSVSILGCVQGGFAQKGFSKNDDCLFCHTMNNSSGARDLSKIYNDNEAHHRTDIPYPSGVTSNEEFNMPSAQQGDMKFFDHNNNGQPDIDEVRIYIADGVSRLTCSSCHREHERSPVVVEHPDDDYLRGTNVASELCVTCHRK